MYMWIRTYEFYVCMYLCINTYICYVAYYYTDTYRYIHIDMNSVDIKHSVLTYTYVLYMYTHICIHDIKILIQICTYIDELIEEQEEVKEYYEGEDYDDLLADLNDDLPVFDSMPTGTYLRI
jgi:hypothetical protein